MLPQGIYQYWSKGLIMMQTKYFRSLFSKKNMQRFISAPRKHFQEHDDVFLNLSKYLLLRRWLVNKHLPRDISQPVTLSDRTRYCTRRFYGRNPSTVHWGLEKRQQKNCRDKLGEHVESTATCLKSKADVCIECCGCEGNIYVAYLAVCHVLYSRFLLKKITVLMLCDNSILHETKPWKRSVL